MHSAELREQVKKILGKLGRLVDGKLLIPEEVVHYSEWLHVMRDRIKERQVIDVSNIRATIHPACHVYKMVPEDVIYDDTVMDGNRVAVSTGLMQTLGAKVVDYSTWYDCCGFGFRHIIGEREFTRSFAIDRKIKVAVDEAKADVMIGHDTGCITTLDKNQWIGKAVDKVYRAADHGRLPVRRARARARIPTSWRNCTGTPRRSRACSRSSASTGRRPSSSSRTISRRSRPAASRRFTTPSARSPRAPATSSRRPRSPRIRSRGE